MASKHSISLQEAIDMTKRYRDQKDAIATSAYANSLPFSETFEKSAFETLTSQAGCTSIRCYLGMDADQTIRLIFVGVDANDQDILPPAEGADIMENGGHCPPICPASPSPLNT